MLRETQPIRGVVRMKDKEAAVRKEIKGRAAVLIGMFGVAGTIFLVMLFPLWEGTGARITLLILLGLCIAGLVFGIIAYRNPIRFKRMFRNLKAEQNIQPRPVKKKPEYKFDTEYGFVSSLFNKPVSVSAGTSSADYVKKCIAFFQNMGDEQIDVLAEKAEDYRQEFYELSGGSGDGMPEELHGRDILDWIYPKTMWIEEEGKNGAIQFGIECDCKWEPEHGLAIVVHDSRIVHVGPWDGDLDK